jgi:hypothetical protein
MGMSQLSSQVHQALPTCSGHHRRRTVIKIKYVSILNVRLGCDNSDGLA